MYSLVLFFIVGFASVQCAPSGIIGAPILGVPTAIGIGGVPLGGAVIGAAPLGLGIGGLGVTKTIVSGPALVGGLGLKGW